MNRVPFYSESAVEGDFFVLERMPRRMHCCVMNCCRKSPTEAGICMDVVRSFYDRKPILGICLEHQSIGAAFGAEVTYAKALFHGKQSRINHDGSSVLTGIPNGEIMAMRHRKYPVIGLQFHPESIYTEHGKRIIENFVNGAY